PALRVSLSGIPMQQDQEISEWLFLKGSSFGASTVSMGPAKISFVEEEFLTGLEKTSPEPSLSALIGKLSLALEGGKNVEVSIQDPLEKELEVPGTPYRIQVLRYLPDARGVEGRLESRSNEPLNPALEFKILGTGLDETHLVFAQFPDLEGVHGRSMKEAKVKARFMAAGASKAGPGARGELLLALHDDKTVFYRVRTKGVLGDLKQISVGEGARSGG